MNLKTSVKYHLLDSKKAIMIFYFVMTILFLAAWLVSLFVDPQGSFGGISSSSIIFLFVVGICSFVEPFNMFIQNGISRHEQWLSFLISGVIISAVMSAIDLILLFISSLLMQTEPLVLMLSAMYVESPVLNVINTFFMQALFYTFALVVGYFIRLLYYRMNKFGVIMISIAVPAFLFIGLPLIEVFILSHFDSSFSLVIDFFAWTASPYEYYGLPMLYLYFLAATVLLSLINKQLIKKAVIK